MAFCASSSLVMADCGGLKYPRSLALDEYSSSASDRGYLSPPQSAMTRLELAQKAIGWDTGVEEYWKRADAENGKREKRERETVKSSGTAVKLPDVSRETFPIDDRLNNGHNEA